ncbi:MAG: pyridoxamine 5'-phosphate oxidase family protein [Anaerolineae bacterium]
MSDSPQIPRSRRPLMPEGYGISTSTDGMIGWDWVETRLKSARNYWICTTRPNGNPHAAPVWGVWYENALYFGVNPQSRKGRNMLANPNVVVHLESGDEVVILESIALQDSSGTLPVQIVTSYAAKYNFTPDPNDPNGPFFIARPKIALAWLENDFPRTATRFEFE